MLTKRRGAARGGEVARQVPPELLVRRSFKAQLDAAKQGSGMRCAPGFEAPEPCPTRHSMSPAISSIGAPSRDAMGSRRGRIASGWPRRGRARRPWIAPPPPRRGGCNRGAVRARAPRTVVDRARAVARRPSAPRSAAVPEPVIELSARKSHAQCEAAPAAAHRGSASARISFLGAAAGSRARPRSAPASSARRRERLRAPARGHQLSRRSSAAPDLEAARAAPAKAGRDPTRDMRAL